MSLSSSRQTQGEAPKDLRFYENATTMNKVANVLFVMTALFAAGTAIGAYFLDRVSIDSSLVRIVAYGGTSLTVASLLLGIYLKNKAYWRDCAWLVDRFKNYDFNNIEDVTAFLRRGDLHNMANSAFDTHDLAITLNYWIKDNPVDLVSNFHKRFGWRPFELGILEAKDRFIKDAFTKSVRLAQKDDKHRSFVLEHFPRLQRYGFTG